MSATTAPMTLDVAGTPRVPMSRLAKVELRKALDTRAGLWFTLSILALVAVVELIYSFAADDDLKDFARLPADRRWASSATSSRS